MDAAPAQSQQLAEAQSAEGGDDEQRRVLLVGPRALGHLLRSHGRPPRIAVASLARRTREREHLLGLVEVDRRVVGFAALVRRRGRVTASEKVSSRIAWRNTEHRTWRCLFTVRGPNDGSASSRARKRAISTLVIEATGRCPKARMIRAAGTRPLVRGLAVAGAR